MEKTTERITARDVIDQVLPKLKATERLVTTTLQESIGNSHDNAESARLENLKLEFDLEISMIRMNLQHLMHRYADELEEAAQSRPGYACVVLELDEHEAVAVESAMRLYHRAQEWQTR